MRPRPATAMLSPGPAPQWHSGEQVAIPAHRIGVSGQRSLPRSDPRRLSIKRGGASLTQDVSEAAAHSPA